MSRFNLKEIQAIRMLFKLQSRLGGPCPLKGKCLILFIFLIIYVNYGLAYEDNYTFELKTLTRQLPEDVWRLYTTKP